MPSDADQVAVGRAPNDNFSVTLCFQVTARFMQALRDAHVALGQSRVANVKNNSQFRAGPSTYKWPAGNVYALEPGT